MCPGRSEDEPFSVFLWKTHWGRLKPRLWHPGAANYPGGCGLGGQRPGQRSGLAWVGESGGRGWKRRGKQPSEIWEALEKRQLGAAAGSSQCELPLAVPTAPSRGGSRWALSSSDAALHPRDVLWGVQPSPASSQTPFPPLRREQSRELALCSQQGGFEQDNPLVRHQTAACEPSAALTQTPREKLLDWKKDINLKSTQQSNCRVFPPPSQSERGKADYHDTQEP